MRLALLLLLLCFQLAAHATCTVQTEIRDTIGPATVDLVKRAQALAERKNCDSILLLINTPGGSLDSTRIVVELILESKLPYLCLVSPSGGHAGSAGAIILQACPVNGALHGTNLGAATPVSLGQDLPKDLRQKIVNDTRSWLESLTRLRGRNERFGQDIVIDAKAVTAEDAQKLKAIDFVGDSPSAFLKFAEGRKVKLGAGREESVKTGEVEIFPLDLRYKVLSLCTDPELAYMMLLGSLGLLYFELTHPGTVIPGVVGGVGLVVAMLALHKLDVEWAGLILIFLGVALMVAEMFLPTFGALGVGGVVALLLGSLFLFDPVKTGGYSLPLLRIIPAVAVFALFFLGVSLLLWRTRRVKRKSGFEEMTGLVARVSRVDVNVPHEGLLELRGETWKFEADRPVSLNDSVRITANRGLVLLVEVENKKESV